MIIDLTAGDGGWSLAASMLAMKVERRYERDERRLHLARSMGRPTIEWQGPDLDPRLHNTPGEVEGIFAAPDGTDPIHSKLPEAARHLTPANVEASQKYLADRDVDTWALQPLRWTLNLRPRWTLWKVDLDGRALWEASAAALAAAGYHAAFHPTESTVKRSMLLLARRGKPLPALPAPLDGLRALEAVARG